MIYFGEELQKNVAFSPPAKHPIAILYLCTTCISNTVPPQIISFQQHCGICMRLGQRKDDALRSPREGSCLAHDHTEN